MNGAESNKLKPALIAGVSCGVVSSIPIVNCVNLCCCALVIGGGVLAVYLYLKDAPGRPEPPYGDGAVLGALTGVFAAVTATVISIPLKLVMGSMGMGDGGLDQLWDGLEEAGVEVPPQVMEMMETVMGSGGLTIMSILAGFFFSLVIYCIFATLGGVLGAAILHGKVGGTPAASSGYAPPPPPAA